MFVSLPLSTPAPRSNSTISSICERKLRASFPIETVIITISLRLRINEIGSRSHPRPQNRRYPEIEKRQDRPKEITGGRFWFKNSLPRPSNASSRNPDGQNSRAFGTNGYNNPAMWSFTWTEPSCPSVHHGNSKQRPAASWIARSSCPRTPTPIKTKTAAGLPEKWSAAASKRKISNRTS